MLNLIDKHVLLSSCPAAQLPSCPAAQHGIQYTGYLLFMTVTFFIQFVHFCVLFKNNKNTKNEIWLSPQNDSQINQMNFVAGILNVAASWGVDYYTMNLCKSSLYHLPVIFVLHSKT
jgi:hypothetical protein